LPESSSIGRWYEVQVDFRGHAVHDFGLVRVADKRGMLSAEELNDLLTELFPLPAMAKGSEKK
jgi:hypothetical protein